MLGTSSCCLVAVNVQYNKTSKACPLHLHGGCYCAKGVIKVLVKMGQERPNEWCLNCGKLEKEVLAVRDDIFVWTQNAETGGRKTVQANI